MTADRCRWHDNPGRCPEPLAFPGVAEVPELCSRHILALEPWIRSRSRQPSDAEAWIALMARKSQAAERELGILGAVPPMLRPGRTGPS